MSTPAIQTPAVPSRPEAAPVIPRRRKRLRPRGFLIPLLLISIVAGLGWGGLRLYRSLSTSRAAGIPTTRVRRGDVYPTVTAKGELKGGNSEELAAPMIGAQPVAPLPCPE